MSEEWVISGAECTDKRGKVYDIITRAKDIQTGDQIVVYKQQFGGMETLCCPLDAFLISFVPRDDIRTVKSIEVTNKPLNATDRMMRFLDTDDFKEKITILKELHILGELTDNIIDNLAATLDVVIEEGGIDERYDQLRICVETRARYESTRLR